MGIRKPKKERDAEEYKHSRRRAGAEGRTRKTEQTIEYPQRRRASGKRRAELPTKGEALEESGSGGETTKKGEAAPKAKAGEGTTMKKGKERKKRRT